MARPVRIDIEDGIYHVMSRGTERCDLFSEEADYLHFLDRLAEAQRRFRLSLHGYVLMKNHFHLIAHLIGCRVEECGAQCRENP